MLALVGVASSVRADSPLPPASLTEVSSPDGSFRAVADPTTDRVSVFKRGTTEPVWSLPGWHRWVFVANDGDHLVIGPDSLNLLPVGVREDAPLLVFMHRTRRVHAVTVGQLFPGLRGLRPTASHLAWGSVVGISQANRLMIELVDGRHLEFDVSDGRIHSGEQHAYRLQRTAAKQPSQLLAPPAEPRRSARG